MFVSSLRISQLQPEGFREKFYKILPNIATFKRVTLISKIYVSSMIPEKMKENDSDLRVGIDWGYLKIASYHISSAVQDSGFKNY